MASKKHLILPAEEPVKPVKAPPLAVKKPVVPRAAYEHVDLHPNCLVYRTASQWIGFLPRGHTFRGCNSCNRTFGNTRTEAAAKELVFEFMHAAIAAGVAD